MAIFITGGAGGLGSAIARGFADRGRAVALVDLDGANAEREAEKIRTATGIAARAITCDITQPASVDAAWIEARSELGDVDVVVNNAGHMAQIDFLDLTLDDWRTTFAINLEGPFHVSQRAVREWVDNGVKGSIVNISSISAFTAGFGGAVDHGASKAGLIGFTIQLAVDFGRYGIRANAVAPGSFYSPMSAKRLEDPAQVAKSEAMVPLGRIAQPQEIAAVAVFLGLDATYVNGTVVNADGGTAVVM